jgi:ElaB/YqjD/DUF883 family membrane-anchored ribosome-binding protein
VATAAALSVRVSANVGDLQKGMQSAKAAVDDFGKGVDTVSTKAVAIGAAIGTVVANLAIGLAKVSFRAVVDGIGEAIEQSTRFNTALIGLSTVAAGFGHNVNQVTAAARMLSSDGLMTISESANGLKNLLATGFSLPQAIDLMNTFRDSAAFNRQGMLGFGEAVVRATEGIKFGNSALTDSTGLGKNLSAIMRDAGLSIDSAGRASQDAGVRQAIYNGFLKEGAVFAGDAAKMSMTYAGATQRLGATWDSFLATIGDAIVQNRSVAEVMNFLADVLVGLSDVLHGNGAAFTFVSDALIVMVKMMSGAVKAIDFLYRAFLSLENIVNSVVATFATGVKKIADMLLAVVAVGSQLPGGTAALGLIKDQVATLAALSAGSGKIADDANRRIEENEASSKAWGSALGGVAQKLDVLAAKLTLTRGMAVEIGVGGRRLAPQTGGGRGGGSSRVSEAQKAALEWQKAAAAWQKVYASLPKVQSGLPAGIGQQLPLTNMTDATLAGYRNTVPVGSSIAGIGESLALPTAPAPPGFFEQAFGSMKDFGANLSQTIMSALTGGGDLGKSLGGFLGGGLLGQLGAKLSSSLGGMLGGIVGNIFGPLGSMLGSMLGGLVSKIGGALSKLFGRGDDGDKERDAFQDQFGGFNKLGAELSKLGAEGERLFQQLQRADSGKEVQAAADQITKALEAHAKAIDGITEGVNARSKNITGQADLDVVGAGTTAAFALMIQQGKSAIEAFNALTPSITAMRDALAAGNLTASESVARMLEIGAVLDANKIQFDNIAASGQILSAMLQGNIRDAGLFGAVAGDIGAQIQAVIDKGVPMAQVFALAQPQLQAIWEAQQKWGFAVDETTAALLAEAEAQGFVGAQMQSVNQQILNVLIAIGNVLGADIPAALGALPGHAQNAANGMQAAFDGIKGPDIGGGGWMPGDPVPVADYGANAPQMASGGIVRARPGGTLVNVGEGGRDEAIVPLGSSLAGMGGRELHLSVDGDVFARVFLPYMTSESQRLGVS